MTASQPVRLKTLLGEHPGTSALRKGELRSPRIALDIADVKAASTAFKRVVRDLEFDLAELAIVTFLIAQAHGKPLVLLPAVVMARFQHPYLVYNPAPGRSRRAISPAGGWASVRTRSPPVRGCAASSPTTTAWTSTA